jgi:hypothetical protein
MFNCAEDDGFDSIRIGIDRAENGFLVRVIYPQRMLNVNAPQVTEILKVVGDGEITPEGIMSGLTEMFKKAELASKEKKLRKPLETYIFPSVEGTLSFIKEVLESDR